MLLKRKFFYSDVSINSSDPIQLNLLYQQAKEAILIGTHPVCQEDGVQFAAFQMQIQFGDGESSSWKNQLKDYLPPSYLRVKKIEKTIAKEHKKLAGM